MQVVRLEILAPSVKLIEVKAPRISEKASPGQFVVIRIDEKGERIPLTIADKNPSQGTITIIFQEVGASTKLLGQLKTGDKISDILGPLGKPSEIKKFGTVVLIGGGVGIAELYPTASALKEIGNYVITIIGARTKELIILEEKLKSVSDELFISTDDGSYGQKGFVSDVLKNLLKAKKADYVLAVGPVPMMKAISEVTKPYRLKTVVSLNPLMLDATGMCGICRVRIGGEVKFACVDGPEFDGHLVDFEELNLRLNMYKDLEKQAYDHVCRLLGED